MARLFYRVTGGLFNPSIALALFLVGIIGSVLFVLFCIAQRKLGRMSGIKFFNGTLREEVLHERLVVPIDEFRTIRNR